MVGDNWERDVGGALGAGLGAAVWISGGRVPPAPGPHDDGPHADDDRITVARGPADVALL